MTLAVSFSLWCGKAERKPAIQPKSRGSEGAICDLEVAAHSIKSSAKAK
jgi:hypothetical protein